MFLKNVLSLRISYNKELTKPHKIYTIFFLLFLLAIGLKGQSSTNQILVSGKVHDQQNPHTMLNELMIVNLATQNGFFGKGDGRFQTLINRTDTLLIGATGYSTIKISFADSLLRDSFYVELSLHKLRVQLREVKIFSPRDLEAIQKDIQKLGYNRKDFELSGIDALSSPITFLYQEFNSLEKLKRHNRERINEEKKRDLLKELFHRYVAWEVIDLQDEEFDRFVDFCNVSEEFMKTSTQYDFIEYIKGKYFVYRLVSK